MQVDSALGSATHGCLGHSVFQKMSLFFCELFELADFLTKRRLSRVAR